MRTFHPPFARLNHKLDKPGPFVIGVLDAAAFQVKLRPDLDTGHGFALGASSVLTGFQVLSGSNSSMASALRRVSLPRFFS